jgi:NTP pyrophosphatase (non-canonical NTP hydrolase)
MRSAYVWKVPRSRAQEASFNDYIEDFRHIYQVTDAQRDVQDILLNLVARTSRVSESVRRKLYGRVPLDLSDTIAWLLSLAAKFKSNLEGVDHIFSMDFDMIEVVWNKYPTLCPICFSREILTCVENTTGERKTLTERELRVSEVTKILDEYGQPSGPCHRCTCFSSSEDPERRKEKLEDENKKYIREKNLGKLRLGYAERRARTVGKRQSISEFEDMFSAIYEVNIIHTSMEDVVFHLQEEVGELGEALTRMYTYDLSKHTDPNVELWKERSQDVCEEFADVISWIFALIMKVRHFLRDAKEAQELSLLLARYMPKKPGGREVRMAIDPEELSLQFIIWLKYGGKEHLRCGDLCKKSICRCPWLIARTIPSVKRILGET